MQARDLITETLPLPTGELRLLQPRDDADLPDNHEVEWAPVVPYWSVLWRSGIALARELERSTLHGKRVVELGCGLGVPSLVAARCGADVVATDASEEALELVELNARENGIRLETERVDWATPDALVERSPFDLVLAADVLYERSSVASLLSLLPRLGDEVLIANPDRAVAEAFFDQAHRDWLVDTEVRGVVRIHRLRKTGNSTA